MLLLVVVVVGWHIISILWPLALFFFRRNDQQSPEYDDREIRGSEMNCIY